MLILLLSTISLLLLPISPLPTTALPIATSMILLSLFSATLAYSQQSMLLFSSSFLMDTMSVSLIFLTLWIAALMILASTPAIKNQARPVALLTLITALSITLLVAFTATNIMLFYVSFEASLIPTLLLIIGWGYQPERLQAGMYLMLYTITASLPLLLALLFMYTKNGHLMLTLRPSCPQLTPFMMKLWWAAMITAFLVKMPMFLVHLWLPKAHVEAPVAGSMVLAGILLKLGGYGLLRISSMFPQLSVLFMPLLSAISLWGAAVCSLICLRQPDLKSLIAYSSVGHMGLLTAGAMTQSLWGLQGALAMMIAHGLCSPALFAIANSTYESTSSRSLFLTKGMLNLFPMMSMWWFLLVATNMAAPPSINLMSEILLLSTILSSSPITLLALGPISFLAAAYSLHLFTSTQHGQPSKMFNPMIMNPRSSSLSMLHLLPLLMMILKPEMITNWT